MDDFEFNEGLGSKVEAWKKTRPNVVVEGGAGASVLMIPSVIDLFKEKGPYADARFLAVDSGEQGPQEINMFAWALGIQADLSDGRLARLVGGGGAAEVWCRNMRTLSDKPTLLQAAHELLQPGGNFLWLDTYSSDNTADVGKVEQLLPSLGLSFRLEDYSGHDGWRQLNHPLISKIMTAGSLWASRTAVPLLMKLVKS
jgi:hypothetical protein